MNGFDEFTLLMRDPIFPLFAGPLLVAAFWDVATMRIPNLLTAAFGLIFLIAAFMTPYHVDWLSHIGAGLLVFAVGVLLFAFRLIGGGDVKLMAGTALWAGFSALPMMLVYIALIGGALSLLLIALRMMADGLLVALPMGDRIRLPRLLQQGQGVPYGVAIAAGALLSAPSLPFIGL